MNEIFDSIADTALGVSQPPKPSDHVRVFRDIIVAKLTYDVGKDPLTASDDDWLRALSLALRDRIVDSWMTDTAVPMHGGKRVYYLSLEFLIGRLLKDALNNMGLLDPVARRWICRRGLRLIAELEPDAALGNGGLGRLAACFMESMATVAFRLSAMASATRLACSGRISTMAGSPNARGLAGFGNPWEFTAARGLYGRLRRLVEALTASRYRPRSLEAGGIDICCRP